MVTSDIQENIMSTRLQPLGSVFSKLPRVVRDLSNRLNKPISVQLGGQEVEVDKSIVEALSDPLTHVIRNSADHGIESPEARKAVGKPAEGKVLVKASNEGDVVTIEISDDGGGINTARVRELAIEKGILDNEKADELKEAQTNELIFHPGFSTAESITGTSGRGVGMDVVKSNIDKLGGVVELSSVPTKGTSIKFKIPLTMAIIPSLLLVAGGRRFAVPQTNLEDLVRIRASEILKRVELLGDSPVIRRRGRLLPLIRLSDVLGLPGSYRDPFAGIEGEERRRRLADRRTKPTMNSEEIKEVAIAGEEPSLSKRNATWERPFFQTGGLP